MKVLILSTFKNEGGAAIAAGRLAGALCRNGVEVSVLYRKNIGWSPHKLRKQSWTSIMERILIWAANGFTTKNLWTTDIALLGQDITKTKEFKEAEVVHLNWVNQGFLSLRTISKIAMSGKKVVWTMHDAWNTMGIYHINLLQKNTWLESTVAKRKKALYKETNIQFVACSEWLRNEALNSKLMSGLRVAAIPNPIDTSLFVPAFHENQRKVLFVAQDINNPFKGMQYITECEMMLPDVKFYALGRDIPYVSEPEQMVAIYQQMDAFALPSLSENLPNTIMEAMACGVPCVGFNVGGIPEMIDHKQNGYLADYKNAQDLAIGIEYVLDSANHETLCKNAREKVLRCYNESMVASSYIDVYNN